MNTSTIKKIDKASVRMQLKAELETALSDLRSEITAVHDGVDIDEGEYMMGRAGDRDLERRVGAQYGADSKRNPDH